MSRKKKLLLFIGIPLIIIVALVIVALSGVNTFLKPVIKKALTKVVVDGSDSLYTFKLKDYVITGGGSSVVFTGLDIRVDSARYKLLKAAGLLPKTIVAAQVEKASVSGLSAWQLWRHKNIICNSVSLSGARVSLLKQKQETDTAAKSGKSKSLYELIQPDINKISVGELRVNDADVDFKTVEEQTSDNVLWNFDSTSIVLEDIQVNENTVDDTTRVLYAANLNAALGSWKLTSSDGLYKFSTKTTEYDYRKKTAVVTDFKMLPAVSQAEFNKRMGHEADFATIILPKLTIEDFNGGALMNDNSLSASVIKLEEPNIELYKDKTAGPDNRNKVGKYPHQLLLKADMKISIQQVEISKGKLVVSQKSPKTYEKGTFHFYNVGGTIKNVTNQPNDIQNDKWCKADLKAGFLGNNQLHAMFSFDLAADNGHFLADATLSRLPPSDINPIFRALANAEMESFSLDKLDYHAEGYDTYVVGDLTLRYHDLKLNVLKKGDDGEKKKKGLISALANLLKLYDANPMPGEAERQANNIRLQRPVNKNFFGAVIKTMLKCAQEIGIKGKNKTLPGM